MKKPIRTISFVAFYALVLSGFIFSAIWGSRTVTVMTESTVKQDRRCIVIDPGHGGEDGGALSCTGAPESGYNLEIALRLNDLLHLIGYKTNMIRSTDTSVYTQGKSIAEKKVSDLKERVRIVNSTQQAILISIHQNHFTDSQYRGAQVFFAKTEGSKLLAEQMQAAFAETVNPGNHRKCKTADGIYLMERVSCTAVLVECGFLSNAEEESNLKKAQYQKNLCCVMASCLSRFLDA